MTSAAALTRRRIAPALEMLDTLTLAEAVEHADLATRVDRKYLVPVTALHDVIADVAGTHRVLGIDGRLATTYRTTYFDTADLASCRQHIQRRRRRWKVRTRLYVEDQVCRVEVKTKDGRGFTTKVAQQAEAANAGMLVGADRAFVARVLAGGDVDVLSIAATSEITYERSCLVDLAHGTRLTIDTGLVCVLDGRRAWLDQAYAVVESKGGRTPSAVDRLLVGHGARARSFSKYVATASLLHPALHDNDVRGLHGTYLHTDAFPTT